jgi:hypothetical protein
MPEMESSVSRTVVIVRALDQQLDVAQRQKVLSWARALLDIRTGTGSARSKAIAAINVARRSGVIGELLERMVAMASEAGWKNRGWPARLGLAAALVTVATVGTGNAGIAALGGAVGVPLWIVLGAGGTLAGTLVEELARPCGTGAPDTGLAIYREPPPG